MGIPVFQPETLKDESARERLRALGADLFVVAAYGLIFSQAVLDIPRLGCVNLHASILPAYRGAAPVNAAILKGDSETGVTLMVMERGLDTGPMISTATTPILPTDTTDILTARLANIGADLAVAALPDFVSGVLTPVPQPTEATAVRQLRKSDGQIDWHQSGVEIERLVRAMWPWPRAWTVIGDRTVQIHSASVFGHSPDVAPGHIQVEDQFPAIACGDGSLLVITRAQATGGKPVTGADLVHGRILQNGDVCISADPPASPIIRQVSGLV
jgi:methionyl-tRNA formyltransferase